MSNPSQVEKKLLHYTGKAIADFNMIQRGDRVMVCLSGGKDSFTLLTILDQLRRRSGNKFELFSFTLDQAQPGWDDTAVRQWLADRSIPHEILTRDTYSIVKEKIPEGKTYCSLCSRLRRGIIYRYAEEHGFNKIALGHHRDDLVRTLMMSILYNGDIRSMPPKLLSDNKKHIVIRPLCYVQEKDIITFANEQSYPIIPCTLCGSQENLMRKKVTHLINQLAEENPKVPSNILHALQSIKPSQLMDQNMWNFRNLENELITNQTINTSELFSTTEFDSVEV
ncbi:tRNA 2-thiocytidine(32) synthetase TtcA [Fluoribacter gormanii]|uniref:tRNA-cytidine(32) 2-sulfurtransferase n=1 Tax=Fluoribacter gormanii TaxID=464 RepID=A0A377GHS7_9GAMM|nr:tRNA 2-thiocytidine(32) synthetase TtcA [Fluoribacter gormanii]KTD02189.1 C32 tRNA thiolase [Fluoribacter gormanii]MCW8444375.1 tRNA 2-thiocytidine(32) synthetase TtcA [Fluoribacter gormanii]MCW8469566.1 tRNA 2-thiocytidine(32) synthetase TtcA [Fluoribacter gormanii]SIR52525.1 tRNA 2-thiocytidine biosynthesis protein TtcA [Fluoribacter gormanii]STO24105.1 tRNA 2-thiocytidine biosynthesis protein TtcA [Fluoribacter gormanii]